MAPSKQWMQLSLHNRTDKIYLDGAKKFVNYAFRGNKEECEIWCPCYKCCNTTLGTCKMIEMHLKVHGIIENYTFWFHHGEQLGEPLSDSEDVDEDAANDFESEDEDEVQELLRDLYPNAEGGGGTQTSFHDKLGEDPNADTGKFYSLMEDFKQPLYQNSKASKVSSLIKLLHIKRVIIPGSNSPGDAIDTYLQPLIEELNKLWEDGIETFDASNKQNFKLHASLLWTINDLPAYRNLSGWSTKGKLSCPTCNKDNSSIRLANCKQECFMGHRRYLPLSHRWRINKNSFDGTFMNIKGKSKDTMKIRLDLQAMNIRSELHPIQRKNEVEVPTACYTLSLEEKHKLCIFLKNLKVPDGFSSNISQCVNLKGHKISGLKSHDYHVLLQHILPLALHAGEAKIVGPIHYRWMYPIERWLYFLKSLACPEGSIAEGYLANECMTLCSRYLHRIDTKFNRPKQNYDGGLKNSNGGLSIFCQPGKTLGAKDLCELEANELEQAHIYILKNCDEVLPYLEEFTNMDIAHDLSDAEWDREFIKWFKNRDVQLHKADNSQFMEDLLSLSRGLTKYSTHCNGYIVNRYRFHAKDYDRSLRTQNCGIIVDSKNGEDNEMFDYYGVLTDVIELQFIPDKRVILFQCNWFDVHDKIKGIKRDEYDYVSVNSSRFLKTNESFVLVDQASQVFYANDNSNKGWHVVKKTQPRDLYEVVKQMDDDVDDLESPSDVVDDLESPTQKKRKRTNEVKFIMKIENEDRSTIKSTMRYTFCAPNAIGKGRGRGLRSLITKGKTLSNSSLSSFYQPNDVVKQYIQEFETSSIGKGPAEGVTNSIMCSSQIMGTTIRKRFAVQENEFTPVNTSLPLLLMRLSHIYRMLK
ncbi:hypothetical protein P3L10_032397 [Capsicum annuum]